MSMAAREAHRLNVAAVGTGHILLALVREGGGPAFQSLRNLGVDLTALAGHLTHHMERGSEVHVHGRLPLTPRATQAVQHAAEEMRQAGHEQVGSGHLLLGVLHDTTGVAADMMRRVCPAMTTELLRVEVLRLRNENDDTAQQSEPPRVYLGGNDPVIKALLSDRARSVLTLASEEARRLNHECVSTAHVFLAIVAQGTQGGANALLNVAPDLKLSRVRHELKRFAPPGCWQVSAGDLPYDMLVRMLIADALEEARRLGHDRVDAGHLVLALAKKEAAAHLYEHLAVRPEEVRQEALRRLGAAAVAGDSVAAGRARPGRGTSEP